MVETAKRMSARAGLWPGSTDGKISATPKCFADTTPQSSKPYVGRRLG
jgi:hypothetical protein